MTDRKPSSYEDMLKKTLLNRTGKGFKRNMGEAKLPDKPQKMSKEEAAEMIFDNILKKRETQTHAPQQPAQNTPSPSEPTLNTNLGYDEISEEDFLGDDFLWSDGPSADLETTQVSKSPAQSYQDALQRTLVNRTGAPSTQAKTLVEPKKSLDQDLSYEDILDDILGFNEDTPEDNNWDSDDLLTKTSYNQSLDSILWPSAAEKKNI